MHRFLAVLILIPATALATPSGEVMQQCWPEKASHVEASQCFAKAYQRTERDLAVAYKKALKKARAFDAEWQKMKAEGITANDFATMEAGLKYSQLSFDAYMKSECERRVITYTSGNMRGDAKAICQRDFMLERIKMLPYEGQPGI